MSLFVKKPEENPEETPEVKAEEKPAEVKPAAPVSKNLAKLQKAQKK